MSAISPSHLGLPPKFPTWRPGQWASLETTTTSDRRFIAQSAPTGFGKSLWTVAAAVLNGGRNEILTSSKSLQNQYMDDFRSMGLVDMRGRNNFPCVEGGSCSEGRILGCKDQGCPYKGAQSLFNSAKLGITNYAYHLSAIMHSDGVGAIDGLFLDEAHAAITELSSAIEIRLHHATYEWIYQNLNSHPPYESDLAKWRTWATWIAPKANTMLTQMRKSESKKGIAALDAFCSYAARISSVPEDWILDETSSTGETLIAPLWPTDYAEKYLFNDVKRVFLVSATLVPKTLTLLGIKPEESLFLSHDHTFHPNRAPVYLYGQSYIDYKSTPAQLDEWVAIMDLIIKNRLDRKGIIHTVSYDRLEFILNNSQFREYMIAPRRARDFAEALYEFRQSPAPRIFVSPAVTTGYDFPYSAAEYQIIGKMPFIDKRSPVMAARAKADPEYFPYLTAQTLVQTCGRIMRAPDDQGETFILDRYANSFLRSPDKKGYRHLLPSWFLNQIRYPDSLPAPPPPLARAA